MGFVLDTMFLFVAYLCSFDPIFDPCLENRTTLSIIQMITWSDKSLDRLSTRYFSQEFEWDSKIGSLDNCTCFNNLNYRLGRHLDPHCIRFKWTISCFKYFKLETPNIVRKETQVIRKILRIQAYARSLVALTRLLYLAVLVFGLKRSFWELSPHGLAGLIFGAKQVLVKVLELPDELIDRLSHRQYLCCERIIAHDVIKIQRA